jgi:hypothetical protein
MRQKDNNIDKACKANLSFKSVESVERVRDFC